MVLISLPVSDKTEKNTADIFYSSRRMDSAYIFLEPVAEHNFLSVSKTGRVLFVS